MNLSISNYDKVEKELIYTWQPLAAIAYRADLPIRTCETILVDMYNRGLVKCSRVRIDGHNKVHLFKKVQMMKVMGIHTVIDTSHQEHADA